VALVRTDTSQERIASIISMKRISELGTTLAVATNDVRSSLILFIVTAVKITNLTMKNLFVVR
jgi:hypothetical protein